ncbi:MAG: DUF2796 domain-containing protein [Steroidobacteraceae bacterium]
MKSVSSGAYPAPFLRSIVLLCALVATGAAAQQDQGDHEHDHDHDAFEQHGVHEHGKVTFNVALEGQQLVIEFDAPAANVIGFEHAPRTDAEKIKVRDQAAWLQAGRDLVTFAPAAGCRFQESKLEAPEWKPGQSHADYEVRLTYRCDQPRRLDWLQLSMLEKLQEVHEARVNLLTPARQGSETVKSADARVKLQ